MVVLLAETGHFDGIGPSGCTAVENGETPFYTARLEEELRNHLDFELTLVACQPESELEADTDA